ncbi:hypothetical protein DER45DRAFT_573237 [Fusarium avenaceum]|nr:hypothetical protein DER45DRAFT_573237 [Fusarium avenaceum]
MSFMLDMIIVAVFACESSPTNILEIQRLPQIVMSSKVREIRLPNESVCPAHTYIMEQCPYSYLCPRTVQSCDK